MCIRDRPYMVNIDGQDFGLTYQPGEGNTSLFGGNSNWRGPVWMPMNYLLVLSLNVYSDYYTKDCMVEYPTNSGQTMALLEASNEISKRLISIFQKDTNGNRPVNN